MRGFPDIIQTPPGYSFNHYSIDQTVQCHHLEILVTQVRTEEHGKRPVMDMQLSLLSVEHRDDCDQSHSGKREAEYIFCRFVRNHLLSDYRRKSADDNVEDS